MYKGLATGHWRMMKVGILLSRVRVEEKWLLEALDKRGVAYERIDDRETRFDLANRAPGPVRRGAGAQHVLRARAVRHPDPQCLGHPHRQHGPRRRGLRRQAGHLRRPGAGRRPPTAHQVAFTPEVGPGRRSRKWAIRWCSNRSSGSWGRLLSKINDRDAAEAVLEHKETLGSYQHSIYYIQEYIQKPGRDIRAFVVGDQTICAIYRILVALDHQYRPRRVRAAICPVTPELHAVVHQGRRSAVGGGVLAVDVLEDPNRGFLINEVNHTMEFHTLAPATGMDIAGVIVDYTIRQGRPRNTSCQPPN